MQFARTVIGRINYWANAIRPYGYWANAIPFVYWANAIRPYGCWANAIWFHCRKIKKGLHFKM